MSKYKLSKNKKSAFEIPYVFVDQYMKKAQPVFVLVYLYGLRLCHEAKSASHQQVAKELNILESDVINAWKYWESVQAVKLSKKSGDTDFDIEFADLSAVGLTEEAQQKPHTYSPTELDIYMQQDKKVKELFDFAQEKLEKLLTPTDLSTLYSFYDFYHLPFEVVFMLIEHYVSQGKKSVRYLEKVALSWSEKRIDTIEKVEEYLNGIQKTAQEKKEAKPPLRNQKNKFINHKQRDIDYNELAKRMLEQRLSGEKESVGE